MIFYIVLILGFVLQKAFSGYIEKVEVSGCESCQLMLTCRKLDSIIAILDVDFRPEKRVFDTGLVRNKTMAFPPDHPRDALNKRCSGLNHCSFIFNEDSPGSEAYGPGNITVKYACATEDKVQKYCNSKIVLKDSFASGFIHNPGYPRFYAGQKRCAWKITVPLYQKIRLKLLDIALFDTRVSFQEDCKDRVDVIDAGQTIFSTCMQEHPPSEVVSATESVEIVLTARQPINPRRGVLIYYAILGCPRPSPARKSYLEFLNESLATFSCCKGYVFPDTQTRTRSIRCFGASWNVSLPLLDCQKPELSNTINLQEIVKMTDSSFADLIAPILLMVILFTINAIVVFYIHRAKKKQIIEVRDEELGTFTQNK